MKFKRGQRLLPTVSYIDNYKLNVDGVHYKQVYISYIHKNKSYTLIFKGGTRGDYSLKIDLEYLKKYFIPYSKVTKLLYSHD